MKRREFCVLPLMLAGCGGNDMAEFLIQPSPFLRTSKNVFPAGVEGNWTPGITFATPGNLSVSFAGGGSQEGRYFRIGSLIFCFFVIATTSFTHTNASGALQITGLPFKARTDVGGTFAFSSGNSDWRGITKAGYTDIQTRVIAGETFFHLILSGSGQSRVSVSATDTPSGGDLGFIGMISYIAEDVT